MMVCVLQSSYLSDLDKCILMMRCRHLLASRFMICTRRWRSDKYPLDFSESKTTLANEMQFSNHK